ncbi:MAG: SDR family NAD(P)-dependent oxidoreductase [Spirochaetales bacterium]|nr:SDR family NAD(P)-dependent oxidoreductase [Spirochaetales bacterium]
MRENILITGANRGLGLSMTRIFLSKGFNVHSINRSESESLKALREEYHDSLFFYRADVRNMPELESVLNEIRKKASSIDILISNAAVHLEASVTDSFTDIDPDKILETLNVNSVGPLRLIRTFIPLVLASRRKLIVSISSEAGSIQDAWRTSGYGYCMSKAALNMMSQILQNRLKNDNVKVLAVHPGWFSSDMGGSEAPITPDVAAEKVVETVLKTWTLKDPVYVDSDAKKMNW